MPEIRLENLIKCYGRSSGVARHQSQYGRK